MVSLRAARAGTVAEPSRQSTLDGNKKNVERMPRNVRAEREERNHRKSPAAEMDKWAERAIEPFDRGPSEAKALLNAQVICQ